MFDPEYLVNLLLLRPCCSRSPDSVQYTCCGRQQNGGVAVRLQDTSESRPAACIARIAYCVHNGIEDLMGDYGDENMSVDPFFKLVEAGPQSEV